MKIKLFIIFLTFSIFFSSVKYADEIQIYADSIDYDSKGNILAKGNVKIISKNGERIIFKKAVLLYEYFKNRRTCSN